MNEDLFDATAAHDSAMLPEEAELIHMEAVMKHIVDELDQMHFTERDLRDTNGLHICVYCLNRVHKR